MPTPSIVSSFLAPLKNEENQYTLCPALTHAFACSWVEISAPPKFGCPGPRQEKITMFILKSFTAGKMIDKPRRIGNLYALYKRPRSKIIHLKGRISPNRFLA